MSAPALIQVHGDRAAARSVIRESAKYAGRDEVLEVFGVYEDELARTPVGWRIARRAFTPIGSYCVRVSPAPAVPAWAEDALGTNGAVSK